MRCYRSARKIVVVTDSFKRTLVRRGIVENKIEVVKNGVDRALFVPRKKDEELLNRLGLNGKTIIGYIGTHGMAHKLDFILRCAKKMEGNAGLHFLFIGDGAMKESLLKFKDELGVGNVTMLESIPKDEVPRYISILDVCLINLKKSPLFETVIPSKIFENASMGIPILMGVEGEAKAMVESYHAGLCYEPENFDDFEAKLLRLLDPSVYMSCKQGGRNMAADFDRNVLARRMLEVIRSLCT